MTEPLLTREQLDALLAEPEGDGWDVEVRMTMRVFHEAIKRSVAAALAATPPQPSAGLRALIQAVEDACPVCGGQGWTVESDPSDESGQTPMQVQCWDAEHTVILNGLGAALAAKPDVLEHPRDAYQRGFEDGRKSAATAAAKPDAGEGLDVAWREAEAALPEGSGVTSLSREIPWLDESGAYLDDEWTASAGRGMTGMPGHNPNDVVLVLEATATGPTPAAALQALAARLRATTDETGGGK